MRRTFSVSLAGHTFPLEPVDAFRMRAWSAPTFSFLSRR